MKAEVRSLREQHDYLLDEFGRIQNQELRVREELLQKSLYLDAVLNSEIDFYFKDRYGRYLLVSRGTAKKLCGPELPGSSLIGKKNEDYLAPACAERFRAQEVESIREKRVVQREDIEEYLDGRRRQIIVTTGPVCDPTGRVMGTYGVTRDITDLMSLRRQIEAILQTSNDAIVMIDSDGKTVLANPAVETLFGYPPDSLLGGSFSQLIQPADVLNQFATDLVPVEGGEGEGPLVGLTVEVSGLRRDGTSFPLELSISPVELESRWFTVAIARDITERKEAERRLQELAERDGLTGLYNQSVFPRKLDEALERATEGRFVVVLADLDRFKPVNDRHGHSIGDQVLAAVAQRLRDCVKRHDLIGRLGGDEFAIGMSMPNVSSTEEIANIMARRLDELKRKVSQPYRVHDPSDHSPVLIDDLGISLGYAVLTAKLRSAKDLLRAADQRMYKDKVRGRSKVKD
ncbi:MAG: diguanylate cyclase [Acidobacteriota bacterium]